MAVKSNRKTTKRTKAKSMNTTYTVVGILVILMLVLLYIMSKPKVIIPTTTNQVTEAFNVGAPSELYNPDKEVLIAFCKMNRCGHCVRFHDDVWTKVEPKVNGKKTVNGKTIKMITVDPEHELSKDVTGFPTIKKYADNAKEYVEFNEKRTVENFTNFCYA